MQGQFIENVHTVVAAVPINTTGAALARVGTSMGGVVAGSFWKEFQPDVMNLASSIFRKPPKAPVKPAKTTEAIK